MYIKPALPLILSAFSLQPIASFAQGTLTPPGTPAPTMKTLDQVQPRTPVDATHTPGNANNLFIISQSGSYYLTTNIVGVTNKNGISIQASDVALDLGGFTMFGGSTNSQVGIVVSGARTGIAIRNGAVRDWGGNGIGAGSATSSEFTDLRFSSNGGFGIKIGAQSALARCTSRSNLGDGIDTADFCSVTDCVAATNSSGNGILTGSGCTLRGCTASGNSYGISSADDCLIDHAIAKANLNNGILSGGNCTVLSSVTSSNESGIFTHAGSTIKDCSATGCPGGGIVSGDRCTVVNCTVSSCGNDGFSLGSACNVLGCSATGNTYGIYTGDGCTIKDTSATYSTVAYGFYTGNGCTVISCTALTNSGVGFQLGSECSILNCTATANNGDGIYTTYSCLVKDNTTASNSRYVQTGGAGIHALNSGNRIESNVSNSDQYGIKVDGTENMVFHNTVRAPISTYYTIVSNNMVGVIIATPFSPAVNGFIGGSGLGTTDPWANFSY